ncbi:MAG TPA: hypothetical protein VI733_02070 [Candidatus Limnocylindria bacterium]|nr:hypothetical protein [Candidatus Limnocylindria bacterium]
MTRAEALASGSLLVVAVGAAAHELASTITAPRDATRVFADLTRR